MKLRCIELLKRRGSSSEQKHLGRRDRIENATTSIYINKNYNCNGKTIILLDDIVTTGASLNACTELLYGSGARLVITAALAVTRRKL